MLDLGQYPAIVAGKTAIVGEIYAVHKDAIERLDAFENVPTLYLRERTRLANATEAWIYVYNEQVQDKTLVRTLPHVPSGNWAEWRRER